MAAYLIVEVELTDPAAYEEYRRQVPPMIAAYGGRYLVRGGSTKLLEGGPAPARVVVLEFPSMERLRAFYDSPEYVQVKHIRVNAARTRMFAVEGV
uniref:DUF1330 domain-containing protein n=1 Tax=uncultured bacterium BLR8 TaxID=506524 RepID=C0IN72_9BACT|nr:protein of unknown function DUF1330 [uncultured bacterium BLR8]